ncbi:MAG: hypothetical protein CMC44_03725 [Flavobacteriaceae bacterium]|nr:hypothetical protein [Gammaproteobacteria bacterium]MAS29708.1 hypothetical protein [Flavobacteriaceae bacterium]|tara:strand:- start:2785 stop:3171 length:387 start_codon:yes stop_codon:yes gene_type:complete
MKNLRNIFKSLLFFCFLMQADALYEDLDKEELERLEYLADNIRCPMCSYGNLSSSNAPISSDLKQEIASLINQGYSDQEIFDFMQDRYGDYILLDTNIEDNRSIFLIPLVVLVISILLVTTYTIRKSK